MTRVAVAVPLITVIASVLILAAAYAFEYLGGLPPCELCYWQRYVYMAAIPFGLTAGALDRTGATRGSAVVLGLVALIFLVGAGIAGYHVGVEIAWWSGPSACVAPGLTGSPEDMFRALMQTPVVRCDEVQWSLFGVSMAGYNVLLSLALAGLAGYGARARFRSDK